MQKKSAGSEYLIGVGGSIKDVAAKIWGQLVVGLLSNFKNRIFGGWFSQGCLYREERARAGIGRETTIQSLLFTAKGTEALIDFKQETRVAPRRWLLQGIGDNEEEDTWGWGSLQEVQERDGEEIA